jgi:signal transduction histidine kinase/ligand-binding sensor domain-containing protein
MRQKKISVQPADGAIENAAFVRARHTLALIAIFCFFAAGQSAALNPSKRITQYQHRAWRVEDGNLPHNPRWISQSADGYLWVGGYSLGVFRFDGVRFVPWVPPTGVSNPIVQFLPSKSGDLWVAAGRELDLIKKRRVISRYDLHDEPSFLPQSMIADADGSIWVVLSGHSNRPVCRIFDGAARCFGEADGIPFHDADAILPDMKGGFWFGTGTSLVHWKPGHSDVYTPKGLDSNAGQVGIASLALGADGSLWVGNQVRSFGLQKFDGREFKPFANRKFDLSKVGVTALLVDHEQNLWVATSDTGLYRIHGETVDHFGKTDGLSSNSLLDLYEDREGILWVTTSNGLDSFRDRNITSFSQSEGLPSDPVVSVMASRDGTVWMGSDGSLDYMRNGEVSSISSRNGLPGSQVTSLFQDRAGRIWVGVDDGLFVYENHHFQRLPEPDHLPLGLVHNITEDADGNIWAECYSSPPKIIRIRGFRVEEEFSGARVPIGHGLAPDPGGGIWLSTRDDLVRFHNGLVEKFPLKLDGDSPRQVAVGPDETVWIAAPRSGLLALHGKSIQRLNQKNGLPCDGVYGFARDDKNDWWLAAPCGYIHLADPELQKWLANPDTRVQYRLFDALDGAKTAQVAFNPTTKSADGRLWFASSPPQSVDPNHLLYNTLPPPVQIEQIIADRNAYEIDSNAGSNADLPPRVHDLEIDYTALSFAAPERNRFKYRLEGRDSNWVEGGARRQAFYSDLPPGRYHFHVIACNNDGVWNETGATLDFRVLPAWFQTGWFRALCAGIVSLLIWTIYHLRVQQLQRKFASTVEVRVNERTRIARELHDTVLQSLHGLLMSFQRAANLLPDRPVEAKQRLESAIDQAAQAITEGREAVQGLRSSTVLTNDLALAIQTLGEELAAEATTQNPPLFNVSVEGTVRDLNPILRDDVYRIAGEALRNAFHHAQARRIEVDLHYDERELRLRVRDDGKGISTQLLSNKGRPGHWGLEGMRERAKLVGGHMEIWSELDSGTEIELRIPASMAYLNGTASNREKARH